jgi:hypothetical protein
MRKFLPPAAAGLAPLGLASIDHPGEAQQLRGYDYVNASSGNLANATATATLAGATDRGSNHDEREAAPA